MKTCTRVSYIEAVGAVVAHVAAHLNDELRLGDLAAQVGFSPYHFHRVFRGMAGESLGDFVRRLRLERAAFRLRTTKEPVTVAAFDAGYETHEAFTRAFRAAFGCCPSSFRRLPHAQYQLPAPCGVHYDPRGERPVFVARDTGGKDMNVEVTHFPERRVACVRHVGPYPRIPEAFDRLCAWAAPRGLFGRPDAYVLAVYHDDPEITPTEELRSDACVTVSEDVALEGDVQEGRIPAGLYARAVHVGPYEQLGDAWSRYMGEWLPASGHALGQGPCFELYVSDPRDTPSEQLRTDLYVALRGEC